MWRLSNRRLLIFLEWSLDQTPISELIPLAFSPNNARYCLDCRKAKTACLCHELHQIKAPIPTHFWVNPKEVNRARSTSWLAHRTIIDSTYAVENQGDLPSGTPALLFPGADSNPWNEVHFDSLLIVDGTWDECKAMILRNPILANMPKISLQNVYQGRFIPRKAPWQGALCTAEALGYLYLEMGNTDGQRLIELVEMLNERELGFRG